MGLPVEVNNLMMGSLGGYNVNRSLRFRSSATAYLNRTPASAGNQQRWTWSAWVKRGAISIASRLFVAGGTSGSPTGGCAWIFQANDTFLFQSDITGTMLFTSTAVYRDPSAWYHLVCTLDTTNATANNRFIFYVNGVQVSGTYTGTITQNANLNVNSTVNHRIAQHTNDQYFDGYMAEMNFIDGQSLTPSSFGAYDTNGIWQPKKYTGTYGTNGFYLPFSNTTSTTTLVQDSSGNGNNWTPNNISLTAGTTYDSMIDSPTVSASASNYAVLNAIKLTDLGATATAEISQGNLAVINTRAANNVEYVVSTIGVTSGKWYYEATMGGNPSPGLQWIGINTSDYGSGAYIRGYRNDNGQYYNGSAWSAYGATYASGDVIGIAFDLTSQTIEFFKNGTSQGQKTSIGVSGQVLHAAAAITQGSGAFYFNFGQRPFSYTPPTGFNALNTYNLPAPSIANGAQYMAATTYTGNGGTQTITNGGNNTLGITFQPDFVWGKSRSTVNNNVLVNSVAGATKFLLSNSTQAEITDSTVVTSLNSNGFTIGNNVLNVNGSTQVAWQWKASGSTVSNTNGTITSTVSANPTAGFSVVTYTGNGSSSATVGHGLGVTPNMIFVKCRSTANGWFVYHSSISAGTYLQLNSTAAANNISATADGAISTSPTSSTFGFTAGSVGVNNVNQNTQTFVAYCFASVSGYSAFGSYTGNGSTDGTFVYTGFRPRFLLVKRTNAAESWNIIDTSRNDYNQAGANLYPDLTNAESNNNLCDILSNGFKLRNTWTGANASGSTYIYAAFAEHPFRQSRAR